MKWLKDARGRRSVTLSFVAPALAVTILKFALEGLTLLGVPVPSFSGTDFAAAFGAIGAVWWGREFTTKGKDNGTPQDPD